MFIETKEREMLTAALLCSFSVPEAGRNFLAYSLNESVDDDNLRIYIALLFNEGGHYRVGALESDEDGQLATRLFSQILREADTGERRDSDVAYHLVDLNKKQLAPVTTTEHRVVSVKKEWIARLLSFQASAHYGPAVEYSPMLVNLDDELLNAAMAQLDEQSGAGVDEQRTVQACEAENLQQTQTPPVESRYSDTGPVPEPTTEHGPECQDRDWPFPGTDPEHFLQDIEASLQAFSGIAQKLTQQKQQSQAQRQTLDTRERQLQERERQLAQKEEQLLQLQEQLHQAQQSDNTLQTQQEARQAELDIREEALQQKAKALAEQFNKLSQARDNFHMLLKSLNETVRFNENELIE
ncbi:hypothetical protein ACQKQA_04560 [Pseudomonas sp. NPDC089530]|uniref:hypothetical protein n=1 Tax=Pseudomonas sp. NPDC089530 TaxID=3390651 RepID=UPI003D008A5B